MSRSSLRQQLTSRALLAVAHRGFEIRRHPAARRQALLTKYQVDHVLDVGAASGGFATQLREFGYRGRIDSFEPIPAAYDELSARSAADDAWHPHHTAIGAEAGVLELNLASNGTSSSFLPMLDSHRDAAPHVDFVDTLTVPVATLDEAVAALPLGSRCLLKIDTQGFEREVLAGASATLSQCVGLQLELSLRPLYAGSMLIDEAVAWAYGAGFQLCVVEQGFASPDGELLQIDGIFFRRP